MNYDITFCGDDCKNVECFRNMVHAPINIPISISSLKHTEYCQDYYIFTFGYSQPHEGRYVKIFGNYESARKKMVDKYGDKWAFQYSATEWQSWLNRKPSYIPIETELEVII